MYDQQLEQIEQLVDQAKYVKALNTITNLEQSELMNNERLALQYLKSTLYLKKGQLKEGKRVAEHLLKKSRETGNQLRELDALMNISWALQWLGQINKGLELVKRGEKLLKILVQEQQSGLRTREAALLYRKGSLLLNQGKLNLAFSFLKKSMSLREKEEDNKGISETMMEIGRYYFDKGELNQAQEYTLKSLAINEAIGDQRGIAHSLDNISWIYSNKGELNKALNHSQKSLAISETIGDQQGIAQSLDTIGFIYASKGELDQALDHFHKSLNISEAIGYQHGVAHAQNGIGVVIGYKGEPAQELKHYQKSLTIYEAIGNPRRISVLLNNIGYYFGEQGDFRSATEYFERSLTLARKNEFDLLISDILYTSIRLFVNELPSETVRSYLDELRQINKRNKDIPRISQRFRLAEAIVLKARGRLTDKVTAPNLFQQIFRQVAEEDVIWLELTVEALINLCELLLVELEITGNKNTLNELNKLSEQLLTISKAQNSHWYIAETYLIQSKLKLLELNLAEAQELLTQAHIIAQEKGLHRLERLISIEHDSLVSHLTTWDKIISQKLPMSEIIKLTQIEEFLTRIIHKRLYQNEEEVLDYAKKARQLVKTWK
ncbi:MAG: tetratricopeptide repeat protein [Promethearchaeota archaeon]